MDVKEPRNRQILQFIQAGNGRPYLVHNNDYKTLYRGVVERVVGRVVNGVLCQPLPALERISDVCAEFKARVQNRLPTLTPYTMAQVTECYRGQKQALYTQAMESVLARDLSAQDAEQKIFVKCEGIDISVKTDPKPRVIRPRSTRFNVVFGQYVKPAEKVIYAAIDRICGGTTVVKGLNAESTAMAIVDAYNSFTDPVVIPLDASHADQSYDQNCRDLTFSMYQTIFGPIPELSRLEAWRSGEQTIHGYTLDGKLKAQGYFGMSSGDMDTSLGMCLVMCCLLYTYLRENKVKGRIICNGDDHLAIIERKNLSKMSKIGDFYRKFGFALTQETPVHELQRVEFCKSYPCYDGTTWIMVRDVRKSLTKDLTCVKGITNKTGYDFFRFAKADCGLALAGDMPILGSFYSMLKRGAPVRDLSKQNEVSGMSFMAKGMARQHRQPTPEARLSFFLTYGWTPDEQRAIEQRYDKITPSWASPTTVDEFGSVPELTELFL